MHVVCEGIDTEFEVMAVTPQTPDVITTEAQPRLWQHMGVCGVTDMTENEASISILSWNHKINFKLGVVVKPNSLSAVQV